MKHYALHKTPRYSPVRRVPTVRKVRYFTRGWTRSL
jgi:hypothetical protein